MDLGRYHFELSFAADDQHRPIPNSSYGPDARNLDTSYPLSSVASSSSRNDGMSPVNSSRLHSTPHATAQPAQTPPKFYPSLVSDAEYEAPSQLNDNIKKDPGLIEDEAEGRKTLSTGTDGIKCASNAFPSSITSYDNPQLYPLSELKSEDLHDEDLDDSVPLTRHDLLLFQSHTSGIPVGEMKLNQPGSYLRYTADRTQRAIDFDFDWKMIKGFSDSDSEEIPFAYRRNYFEVICGFELPGFWCPTEIEYVEPGSIPAVPVDGFAIGISALSSKKSPVELFQFTPKRDKGKKRAPQLQYLSLGKPQLQDGDANAGADGLHQQGPEQRSWAHTYHRLQFSRATANNGRQGQKYFTVRASLYIRTPGETYTQIAYRDSTEFIVRGRAPSYYQNKSTRQIGNAAPATRPSGLVQPKLKFHEENLDDILDIGQSNGHSSRLPCDAASFPRPYPIYEIPESRFDEGILGDIESNGYFGRSNIRLPPINSSFNGPFLGPWAKSMVPDRPKTTYSNFRDYRDGDEVLTSWVP